MLLGLALASKWVGLYAVAGLGVGFLVGMTGVAWSYEDPSAAAKVVKAFRKNDPELMDAVYSGVPAQMVGRVQQIDSALLKDAGPQSSLDIGPVVALNDDRF